MSVRAIALDPAAVKRLAEQIIPILEPEQPVSAIGAMLCLIVMIQKPDLSPDDVVRTAVRLSELICLHLVDAERQ